MQRRELKLDSRRLFLAAALAVAAHGGLYFAVPAVLRLQATKAPDYGDTVIVALDEVPPAEPVVTEQPLPSLSPPPQPVPEPQAVPEPQPVPKVPPAPKPAPKSAPRSTIGGSSGVPLQKEELPTKLTGSAFRAEGKSAVASPAPPTRADPGVTKNAQPPIAADPSTPAQGTPQRAASAGTASVQRSGEAVDVKTATAKSAGSTTTGSAPGSTAGTSSTLSKELAAVDKALAAAGTGGKAATTSGSPSGTGTRDFSVVWNDPDAGKDRELVDAPKPRLPGWVAEQGLPLSVSVAFTILPEGVVARASTARTSGYADVDAAVLEAVRRWKFSRADTTRTVGGTILYKIRVD